LTINVTEEITNQRVMTDGVSEGGPN